MPRSTRTPVAATGLLLACVLATSACTGSTGTNANAASSPQLKGVGGLDTGVFPAASRRTAPKLAGTTLAGAQLDVDSLRGKVVVLNFWGFLVRPVPG